MNAEEASLLWHRKADIEQAGGDAAHRKIALKHLKLKTVIKVRRGYQAPAAIALLKQGMTEDACPRLCCDHPPFKGRTRYLLM